MSYADIINAKKKEWNCSALMDGAKVQRGLKIPFSSPLMNWATYGGIPRNRITEFFGETGGGKSTSSVDICKNAIIQFDAEYQIEVARLRDRITSGDKNAHSELADLEERGPKKILYIDIEHAFDGAWAKTLGIDSSRIDVMQPPDVMAEDILQMTQEVIATGEVGLIVLDSIPTLVPKAELDKKLGERTVAALAGLLTVYCRKVVPLLDRYDCTMIFINQIRDNMDNPYVVRTPGGKAPSFYASLRIAFRIGQPVDFLGNELPQNTENPSGYIINAKIVKQKSAPFDRKQATYYLMCSSGLRPDFDFANLAVKKYGIIRKAGAWFTMCDPYTGEVVEENGTPVKVNGMAKVYDYLQNHEEYYEKLKTYIVDDINGVTDETTEETEENIDE